MAEENESQILGMVEHIRDSFMDGGLKVLVCVSNNANGTVALTAYNGSEAVYHNKGE